MQKIFWIALAGGFGALARYKLAGIVQQTSGSGFPWGTFAVNVTGCFLFGLVWSLAEGHTIISVETRAIILTGFMGAFTTFSTFIFDTDKLFRGSQWLSAAGNITFQIIIGLGLLSAGFKIGGILG